MGFVFLIPMTEMKKQQCSIVSVYTPKIVFKSEKSEPKDLDPIYEI